jgi:L-fuconolactonase
MMMLVDAHQHYWEPRRGDYDWMPMDDAVLARRYRPADLAPALAEAGIGRTVLVQAAATVEETEYMLGLADATPSVAAVVGWVDFEDKGHLRHLERLKKHPKFVGVRPMIQDIPDVDWMLRDDVQWAYAALVDLDLTFDALGFSRHLANFLTLLERYPKLRVVIDHCMKPQVRDHGTAREERAFWAAGLRRLAAETGAFCKLSGLVTEANEDWSVQDLAPYAAEVLRAFGAGRVMWGSDWPVCRLRASYGQWHAAAQSLCAGLTQAERSQVFGGTAARFYGLENSSRDALTVPADRAPG